MKNKIALLPDNHSLHFTSQLKPVAIKIRIGLAAFFLSSIAACSSGSDDSSGGNTGVASQGQVLTPDLSGSRPVSDYPTNEELAAAEGTPDLNQARALIQGSWAATDDATQCVTSYQFGQFGVFATSSLDQRASGEYQLFEEGSSLELSLDYESENFQSFCEGGIEDSDILDPGLTIGWDITFPDQNSLVFGVSGRESYRFARQ